MQRHPRFKSFVLDNKQLGPSAPFAQTSIGKLVIEVLLSTDAVNALLGAIDAAPARPPHPALDRHLLPVLGPAALDDSVKILCGRVVRQVVEHLGGRHVRKGVPITVASVFANGSVYVLPSTRRGKFGPAERLAWVEEQLAVYPSLSAA